MYRKVECKSKKNALLSRTVNTQRCIMNFLLFSQHYNRPQYIPMYLHAQAILIIIIGLIGLYQKS